MTKLKICGLRDYDSANVAVESGANFLGFVFVPGARRCLEMNHAKNMIENLKTKHGDKLPGLVGLFANQKIARVNKIVHHLNLDLVQLCGGEEHEYVKGIDVPTIKQVKVVEDEQFTASVAKVREQVELALNYGSMVVLDKYEASSYGGTGSKFNWNIAAELSDTYNLILAGGLDCDNIVDAISQVAPWGVDVSSGIETDGIKDKDKIRKFSSSVLQSSQK
mgnify:CR=1 FL=1